jgi:transcriptional regulator
VRHNPNYAVTDEAVVRRLIAENPWATIVSRNGDELVASHYPILLDERDDGALSIVTHVGRPDDQVHGLGTSEVLLIVSGPNGYISPSWYTEDSTPAPTWHFCVAHCYGVPELLTPEENLAVLTRLVDHFEQHVDAPVSLDPTVGARLSPSTVGLRLPISRFVCKFKMGQDLDPVTQGNVLAALRGDGAYAAPALAAVMERTLAAST